MQNFIADLKKTLTKKIRNLGRITLKQLSVAQNVQKIEEIMFGLLWGSEITKDLWNMKSDNARACPFCILDQFALRRITRITPHYALRTFELTASQQWIWLEWMLIFARQQIVIGPLVLSCKFLEVCTALRHYGFLYRITKPLDKITPMMKDRERWMVCGD